MVGGDDDSSSSTPTWMKVERMYNKEVKDMFLKYHDTSHLYIVLDDDKTKITYSINANKWKLQCCQHTQVNRFGFTLHTAAFTAMGIVLCIMFQREAKTQTQVYYRMIFEIFGERHSGGVPDLHRMTVLPDRGY